MIRANQIPDEVAFALLDIYTLWLGDTDQARAAIAAALNAWPGMGVRPHTVTTFASCIILPLPQDASDE